MDGLALELGIGIDPEGAAGQKVVSLINELSRRLGFSANILHYPSSRLSLLASQGLLDGDIYRIGPYGRDHPELMAIPVPLDVQCIWALSTDPDKGDLYWDEIRDRKLSVVYVRSGIFIDIYATSHVAGERIYHVVDRERAYEFLLRGRSDLMLAAYSQRDEPDIDELGERGIYFHGRLSCEPVYLFISTKYEDYYQPILNELGLMKREGLF